MIQNLPAPLHLVLISRSEPDLPLGILRARDEMVEFISTDLQFSPAETRVFLDQILPTSIPAALVALLQARTEGWPAGLRLAALALQNKNPAEFEKTIQSFSGSHRYVSDYLIGEVFAAQPDPVQEFLLKTCILNRLTPSLCDALMDIHTSAATLAELERLNLFIVRLENTGDQTWYRYAPLFAESIQFLARQRLGEELLKAVFEKACAWYEYHGLVDEAIENALAAKAYDRAMQLIEKFIAIHDLSEMQTLGRWLENIPLPEILQHALICFTFAQITLYTRDRFAPATAASLEPYLAASESIWRSQGDQAHLGQLLSFRGTVIWWQAEIPKAFEFARLSLDALPESDALWRGNSQLIAGQAALIAGRVLEAQDSLLEARALSGAAQNNFGVLAAMQILSEVFYWLGELEQAELLDREILSDAVGVDSMLDDQVMASLNLSRIAYERNDIEQARIHAQRAADLGLQRLNDLLQVQACLQLALILAAENDPAGAVNLLKARQLQIQNPAWLRQIEDELAWLSLRSGDHSSLAGWLKILSVEQQEPYPSQKEARDFMLARLRMAEGRPEEAMLILEPWEQDAVSNGRVRSQVQALILKALANRTNLSKATALLNRALVIGQARGFRRIFLDEGLHMAELLQAALSVSTSRNLRLYAATLLQNFPPEMPATGLAAGSTYQTESLSQQELRVLRLLVAGYSNPAIAEQLVVSTNTIKTQVKSIYHKLNVNSRDQARDLARELKLLD
jgi:LuxR family maltose regulon positive regulatory protein